MRRNNGMGKDNITQNQFTAYLMKAVQRTKISYLRTQEKLVRHEIPTDFHEVPADAGAPFEEEAYEMLLLENAALKCALERIGQRERLILLARVLDGRDFESLAAELDLTYKGVASAYYRLIQKMKKEMGGDGL